VWSYDEMIREERWSIDSGCLAGPGDTGTTCCCCGCHAYEISVTWDRSLPCVTLSPTMILIQTANQGQENVRRSRHLEDFHQINRGNDRWRKKKISHSKTHCNSQTTEHMILTHDHCNVRIDWLIYFMFDNIPYNCKKRQY